MALNFRLTKYTDWLNGIESNWKVYKRLNGFVYWIGLFSKSLPNWGILPGFTEIVSRYGTPSTDNITITTTIDEKKHNSFFFIALVQVLHFSRENCELISFPTCSFGKLNFDKYTQKAHNVRGGKKNPFNVFRASFIVTCCLFRYSFVLPLFLSTDLVFCWKLFIGVVDAYWAKAIIFNWSEQCVRATLTFIGLAYHTLTMRRRWRQCHHLHHHLQQQQFMQTIDWIVPYFTPNSLLWKPALSVQWFSSRFLASSIALQPPHTCTKRKYVKIIKNVFGNESQSCLLYMIFLHSFCCGCHYSLCSIHQVENEGNTLKLRKIRTACSGQMLLEMILFACAHIYR